MRVLTVNAKDYRLPNELNDFQREMYVHLVNWKWQHVCREPGMARGHEYDAMLPKSCIRHRTSPLIYPSVAGALARHHAKNDFRIHPYFDHMASSQAANVNLFLPILHHPRVSAILRALRPDLADLATDQLDAGYCLEFWGGNLAEHKLGAGKRGPLGDKSAMAGTDADIAVAYHDRGGELCLWLIEHKLTEAEFTKCGGFKSRGRQARHNCDKTFADILSDKRICYYHDVCKYRYWQITEAHSGLFSGHGAHSRCPFQGGMSQLWRNQLLALAIQDDGQQHFKHVSFSVVKHPRNTYLDATLNAYRELIADDAGFSVLTSTEVVQAAEAHGDADLREWSAWYRELYQL